MSLETFKENRFNVSYVLKTANAYCTQFNSRSRYKKNKKMVFNLVTTKEKLFNQQTFRWTSAEVSF